jgi:hypothetical protein
MTVDKKMEEEIKNKFQRGLTLSVKESLYLFNKYIESLEQQPSEDCVSLNKDVMSELPSVTPQPKVGKWIRSWCEWQQYLECSKCGYETGLRCDTKYCPNCGSKMEVDEC